ncbi:MAG: extracellular solute-binding protein [Bdellovibrionales bacterium]|nr:extracellular solute-binding protein [Bdellovibrionales bacterium]
MFRSYKLLFYVIPFSFLLGIAWGLKKLEKQSHLPPDPTVHIKILAKKGDLPDSFIKEFEKKNRIQIKHFIAKDDRDLLQLALTQDTDIIFSPSYLFPQLIKSNRLRKLSRGKLQNYDSLSSDFLNLPFDVTNQFSIPISWNINGFLVKSHKIESSKIDLNELSSLKEMKNRISILSNPIEIYAQMLNQNLLVEDWIDQQQEDLVQQSLKKYLSQIHYSNSPVEKLVNDDQYWIVQAPIGEAYATLSKISGWDYRFSKFKSSFNTTSLGVSQSSKSEDKIYQFINQLTESEMAHKYAFYTNTPTSIKELKNLPKWLQAEFIRTIQLNSFSLLTAQRALDTTWMKAVALEAPHLLEPQQTLNQ